MKLEFQVKTDVLLQCESGQFTQVRLIGQENKFKKIGQIQIFTRMNIFLYLTNLLYFSKYMYYYSTFRLLYVTSVR